VESLKVNPASGNMDEMSASRKGELIAESLVVSNRVNGTWTYYRENAPHPRPFRSFDRHRRPAYKTESPNPR
jgi:hypothetical protein